MSDESQHHNCPHCGKPIAGYCTPKKPLWWDVQMAYERGETIQFTGYNNYGGHIYWNAWRDWTPKALGNQDAPDWDYFNAQRMNCIAFRIKPEGATNNIITSPIDRPHWSYSPATGQMEEWPEQYKGKSYIL